MLINAINRSTNEGERNVAIIEVGLGGRLDATNVINPELSIITNTSIDHTNLLGSSLESITKEKAGIIKYGKPVLVGEMNNAFHIIENVAKILNAPIYCAQNYHYSSDERHDYSPTDSVNSVFI